MSDDLPDAEIEGYWALSAGNLRPKSVDVEAQWRQVDEWLKFVSEDSNLHPNPCLAASWKQLVASGDIPELAAKRGSDLRIFGKAPLDAMFGCIGNGIYPPPELLLALLHVWDSYLDEGGGQSLEDAFLGPPKRGGGNYARQATSAGRAGLLRLQFQMLLKEGKSRVEAAESLSAERGGKPDADSILRMLRGFPADQAAEK